ncbi:MAG: NADH-quinone oxidoreductase subunit NuoH [Betaproteobacteria bacterium]|nr:NADH-quinone oxidoreductase subunit NuoH [Betaproteobacteria bacterium]
MEGTVGVVTQFLDSNIGLVAALGKIALALVIALQVAPIMVWVERRQAAFIQRRIGPNRVGLFGFKLFGLGQPLADTIKLLFKEDFVPKQANKFFYILAPIVTAVIGLVAIQGIPLAKEIVVGGHTINMQPVNLNAGFLYLFAMSALGVYGVALAGWSSNNKYALLGGLRASAQMISYEIAMGLALLPMVFIYGTLDLQTMIAAQSDSLLFGVLPNWGIFLSPISFVIFVITMFAETNRLPFDLAEGEAELVAGFLVEYGSMRWSLFFLGEYAMMFTLSALTTCVFLGGYEIPWLSQTELVALLTPIFSAEPATWVASLIGLTVLLAKTAIFMFLFVQARFTLPRFRYDQLMRVGWVYLLPLALVNVVVLALIVGIMRLT